MENSEIIFVEKKKKIIFWPVRLEAFFVDFFEKKQSSHFSLDSQCEEKLTAEDGGAGVGDLEIAGLLEKDSITAAAKMEICPPKKQERRGAQQMSRTPLSSDENSRTTQLPFFPLLLVLPRLLRSLMLTNSARIKHVIGEKRKTYVPHVTLSAGADVGGVAEPSILLSVGDERVVGPLLQKIRKYK
jgi:hypothetical protein